jgi:hypothetical protein
MAQAPHGGLLGDAGGLPGRGLLLLVAAAIVQCCVLGMDRAWHGHGSVPFLCAICMPSVSFDIHHEYIFMCIH